MDTGHIDIMLILDADLLDQRYPDPSQYPHRPTPIGADEAFIVAVPRRIAPRGQAGNTLELYANRGDQIHWRAIALSGGVSHAILYRIETDDQTGNKDTAIASTAVMLQSGRTVPIPDPAEPTRYAASAACDALRWSSDIARPGRLHCRLSFYLVRQHDIEGHLDISGYYRWDCTLNIGEFPAG